MNKGLWIARKNYLFQLIKKVSDGHGGDNTHDLQVHFHQVLEMCPNEKIEQAINCYEQMVQQLKLYLKRSVNEVKE